MGVKYYRHFSPLLTPVFQLQPVAASMRSMRGKKEEGMVKEGLLTRFGERRFSKYYNTIRNVNFLGRDFCDFSSVYLFLWICGIEITVVQFCRIVSELEIVCLTDILIKGRLIVR